MPECYPFKLVPCYKNYLWGGDKLKQLYGKDSGFPTTAESWELASRPDGMSRIENGAYAGSPLGAVLERHPELSGQMSGGKFPILVKLIDATKDLSIQVHPSDVTARPELCEEGKTEMWYVISAEPQAFLYFGLNRTVTREELIASAKNGTICELLNRIPVKRGDVFSIQPGTIHAIGRGLVIAEVQQNSNTTFRIYDYLRRDQDGNFRPLNLSRAAEVSNLSPIAPNEYRANTQFCFPGFRLVQLVSCSYFEVYKAEVASEIRLLCIERCFTHLLVLEGRGSLCVEKSAWPLSAGDSWFLPAGLGEYTISGGCVVLLSMPSKEGNQT